jgi:hypothetical protein
MDAQVPPYRRANFAILAVAGENGHPTFFPIVTVPYVWVAEWHHHKPPVKKSQYDALVVCHQCIYRVVPSVALSQRSF